MSENFKLSDQWLNCVHLASIDDVFCVEAHLPGDKEIVTKFITAQKCFSKKPCAAIPADKAINPVATVIFGEVVKTKLCPFSTILHLDALITALEDQIGKITMCNEFESRWP